MKTILDRLEETIVYIGVSSKGRTTDFDSVGIGSIPVIPANAARRLIWVKFPMFQEDAVRNSRYVVRGFLLG